MIKIKCEVKKKTKNNNKNRKQNLYQAEYLKIFAGVRIPLQIYAKALDIKCNVLSECIMHVRTPYARRTGSICNFHCVPHNI